MDAYAMVLQGWNFLLTLVGSVFNLVFFWLPNDPLADYLSSVETQAAMSQGVRWLNWFCDVSLFAGVLSAFVGVLLLFAVFKIVMWVVKFVFAAVDAVPLV